MFIGDYNRGYIIVSIKVVFFLRYRVSFYYISYKSARRKVFVFFPLH